MTPFIFILFDNSCVFCNRSVMYIAKKDKKNICLFIANHTLKAKEVLENCDTVKKIEKNSIQVIVGNKVFYRSKALRTIFRHVTSLRWIYFSTILLPNFILDIGYRLIAKNRKSFFSNSHCPLPHPSIIKKFILE